ncbi:endo alpha-1,4 polygalactosaminidase [Streptomyces hebeiensis]|uniref:endo alpha-1,4 polygalactosaminidase n=1 Tax=Streptomyces hebeiensis TaxID=229486 RepID=UPI0031DEF3FB
MPLVNRVRSRRCLAAAAVVATAVVTPLITAGPAGAAAQAVTLPPAGANFDYQIGGAYTPPAGVKVVSRDYTASPAAGLYNICYVNAFQTQPGAEGEWEKDLLLRDSKGNVVYDGFWKEAVLDTRTEDKRKRIAAKVNGWIDTCANKGFKAVEPDNLDTFDRFSQLNEAGAKDLIKRLADHAHSKGLAIAQKNTAGFSTERDATGADFAIAEECGEWDECGDYVEGFGNNVIVIEYKEEYLRKSCSEFGGRLSIVLRDLDVKPLGDPAYVRKTC